MLRDLRDKGSICAGGLEYWRNQGNLYPSSCTEKCIQDLATANLLNQSAPAMLLNSGSSYTTPPKVGALQNSHLGLSRLDLANTTSIAQDSLGIQGWRSTGGLQNLASPATPESLYNSDQSHGSPVKGAGLAAWKELGPFDRLDADSPEKFGRASPASPADTLDSPPSPFSWNEQPESPFVTPPPSPVGLRAPPASPESPPPPPPVPPSTPNQFNYYGYKRVPKKAKRYDVQTEFPAPTPGTYRYTAEDCPPNCFCRNCIVGQHMRVRYETNAGFDRFRKYPDRPFERKPLRIPYTECSIGPEVDSLQGKNIQRLQQLRSDVGMKFLNDYGPHSGDPGVETQDPLFPPTVPPPSPSSPIREYSAMGDIPEHEIAFVSQQNYERPTYETLLPVRSSSPLEIICTGGPQGLQPEILTPCIPCSDRYYQKNVKRNARSILAKGTPCVPCKSLVPYQGSLVPANCVPCRDVELRRSSQGKSGTPTNCIPCGPTGTTTRLQRYRAAPLSGSFSLTDPPLYYLEYEGKPGSGLSDVPQGSGLETVIESPFEPRIMIPSPLVTSEIPVTQSPAGTITMPRVFTDRFSLLDQVRNRSSSFDLTQSPLPPLNAISSNMVARKLNQHNIGRLYEDINFRQSTINQPEDLSGKTVEELENIEKTTSYSERPNTEPILDTAPPVIEIPASEPSASTARAAPPCSNVPPPPSILSHDNRNIKGNENKSLSDRKPIFSDEDFLRMYRAYLGAPYPPQVSDDVRAGRRTLTIDGETREIPSPIRPRTPPSPLSDPSPDVTSIEYQEKQQAKMEVRQMINRVVHEVINPNGENRTIDEYIMSVLEPILEDNIEAFYQNIFTKAIPDVFSKAFPKIIERELLRLSTIFEDSILQSSYLERSGLSNVSQPSYLVDSSSSGNNSSGPSYPACP